MKITLDAVLVADHPKVIIVLLDSGFGSPEITIAKDKVSIHPEETEK